VDGVNEPADSLILGPENAWVTH